MKKLVIDKSLELT